MNPIRLVKKLIILIIYCIAVVVFWNCDKKNPTGPTPNLEEIHANHDDVIEYDPVVGGIFEGDETSEFPDDIEPEDELLTYYIDNETNTLSDETVNQAKFVGMNDLIIPELEKLFGK